MIKLIVGVVIAVIYWFKLPHMPAPAVSNLMTTISSVFATLLGFIITAITLLASLLDKPLLRNMQKTGHYKRLMTDAFDTCLVLLVLVLCCLIGLMLTVKQQEILVAGLIALVIMSILCLFQTGKRLFNIVKVLS
ncbi:MULTISPECIES: hypothetical protein [Serratia]|uniref:hypothetical protein n=1 Tax=Serratia TaxID=613 RepID=UPI00209D4ADE|nr:MULTISPECIES: hypothetical protein [Serratia]MCP1106708.1 hypothetical protein [Serratia nevei]